MRLPAAMTDQPERTSRRPDGTPMLSTLARLELQAAKTRRTTMPHPPIPAGPLADCPLLSEASWSGPVRPADLYDMLQAVMHGMELDDHDQRILGWLARWDWSTVATICSLIARARTSGPLPGWLFDLLHDEKSALIVPDPADLQHMLHMALHGVGLGDYDQGIIGWLAGWESSTVATICSLIARARTSGPLPPNEPTDPA